MCAAVLGTLFKTAGSIQDAQKGHHLHPSVPSGPRPTLSRGEVHAKENRRLYRLAYVEECLDPSMMKPEKGAS
jgi:hypothetical protein